MSYGGVDAWCRSLPSRVLAMPVTRHTEGALSTERYDFVNPSGSGHRAPIAHSTLLQTSTHPHAYTNMSALHLAIALHVLPQLGGGGWNLPALGLSCWGVQDIVQQVLFYVWSCCVGSSCPPWFLILRHCCAHCYLYFPGTMSTICERNSLKGLINPLNIKEWHVGV